MSDPVPASSGRHHAQRLPRVGDGQAPFTTVIVLVAAATAVVAGFVILGSIDDPAGGSGEAASNVATTTVTTPLASSALAPSTTAITTTTTTTTTTTVAPSIVKSAATIIVANASGVDRSATAMTAELAADGYMTTAVANTTGPRLELSVIYYVEGDPAALGVARLLARQIPTAQVLPMPQPPPLDRLLNGATVALILGRDAAGRPLPALPTG